MVAPKQTGPRPTDLPVSYRQFHSSKISSPGKTISISACNGFSPLKTNIFSRRNWFIKNLNRYENRLYMQKYSHLDCTELFLRDLKLILWYFEIIAQSYGKVRGLSVDLIIYYLIVNHKKTHASPVSTLHKSICDKWRQISDDLSPKSCIYTSKQPCANTRIAIRLIRNTRGFFFINYGSADRGTSVTSRTYGTFSFL